MSVFQRRTKQTCLALSSAVVLFFVILSLTPAFLDLDSHEPFVLINEKLQPGLNFLGGKKQRGMEETTSPEPDSSRFPPREHIISRPVDVGVGNDIAPTDKVGMHVNHLKNSDSRIFRNCNLSLQHRLVKYSVITRSQSTAYRLYFPITGSLSMYVNRAISSIWDSDMPHARLALLSSMGRNDPWRLARLFVSCF